jgi:cell division protein FtsN
MKKLTSFPLPIILEIVFFVGVIVGIPFAVIQLQQQQDPRSRASINEATWYVSQSADTECANDGSGVVIKVSFQNKEPKESSTAMDIEVTDKQTDKSIEMKNVQGGETRTGDIKTNRKSLSSGTVEFSMTWTDGRRGVDTRTAKYDSKTCKTSPTPTPTKKPTPTPTPSSKLTPTPTKKPTPTPTPTLTLTPSPTNKNNPTPTICPTLGPVENVHIECPNCP